MLVYGGDRVTVVPAELAESFAAGDRLVIVQDTGDLLHIPRAEHELVSAAVTDAVDCVRRARRVQRRSDHRLLRTVRRRRSTTTPCSLPCSMPIALDVDAAAAKGRSTTRLVLSPAMRRDMAAGLRSWAASPTRRDQLLSTVDHDEWSVSSWRAPLGVVGFVFEGRPNVFADATGVLRTGNTAVFRIGSDALGTAQAIMRSCVAPALGGGRPAGGGRAAGRVGGARRRVGAVRRQRASASPSLAARAQRLPSSAPLPASTAYPSACTARGERGSSSSEHADVAVLADIVEHSLDRKVCNTMNVCCIPRSQSERVPQRSSPKPQRRAAATRGTEAVIHQVGDDGLDRLGQEWEWEDSPEFWLVEVESLAEAVDLFNRYSPRFAASLVSDDRRRAGLVLRGDRCTVRGQRVHAMGRRAVRARSTRARPVELAGRATVRAGRRAVG